MVLLIIPILIYCTVKTGLSNYHGVVNNIGKRKDLIGITYTTNVYECVNVSEIKIERYGDIQSYYNSVLRNTDTGEEITASFEGEEGKTYEQHSADVCILVSIGDNDNVLKSKRFKLNSDFGQSLDDFRVVVSNRIDSNIREEFSARNIIDKVGVILTTVFVFIILVVLFCVILVTLFHPNNCLGNTEEVKSPS